MDPQQLSWATPSEMHANPTQEVHHVEQQQQDGDFLTQPFSTLDEPVRETIMRDVRSVASKIKVVLLPLNKTVR